jgi:hypothetical protein
VKLAPRLVLSSFPIDRARHGSGANCVNAA